MIGTLLLICAAISAIEARTVVVGQTYDHTGLLRRVYEKSVESSAIPFFKRESEVLFEFPAGNQQTLKGIAIKDLDEGLAEPSITRGGIGFPYVNIKLKSQRGSGFRFLIELYA